MTTIREIKREVAAATDSAEKAQYLIEDYFGWSSSQVMMEADRELTVAEESKLREMADRLKSGEPLQYVTGRAYFRGRYYKVDGNVLIPRPETSELVDWVLEEKMPDARVIDIGTGSGIIACSIKEERRKWEVAALDVSSGALEVAAENAGELNIRFVLDDILNLRDRALLDDFNIVVSNPPYVLNREKADMERHVLDYEPHLALFVPDDDPLKFYRRIAELLKESHDRVPTTRWLFFEINEAFSSETMDMMFSLGYVEVECRNDAYGKPRMCRGALV